MIDDVAARVVQAIARSLAAALERETRSLRQFAAGSGVNRQAIADLLAGRCWPDVATVARLENFLTTPLYPAHDRTIEIDQNTAFPSPDAP
ncbi:helix-turn-helix domain-containing protein [Streptomyces sp. M-16]|uniref:helix-turn-helix domain-containing protein n=1 Tax=Streptomyces sp. M-16 TaxID=3233040 RepID=UPI003F9C13CF